MALPRICGNASYAFSIFYGLSADSFIIYRIEKRIERKIKIIELMSNFKQSITQIRGNLLLRLCLLIMYLASELVLCAKGYRVIMNSFSCSSLYRINLVSVLNLLIVLSVCRSARWEQKGRKIRLNSVKTIQL